MLELVALSCTVMSQRKYTDSITSGESGERSKLRNRISKTSHHDTREHKYSRNSSEDPAISSTRSDKHVSSNARSHPRAELKASDHSHSHRSKHVSSNHVHNHASPKSHDTSMSSHDPDVRSHDNPSTPNRKRGHDSIEDDIWTEHTSSSGRVYYYNKRLDKSQWERPMCSPTKKAKTETTKNSSVSGRKIASTSAVSSSSLTKHSHSHSHYSSQYHKDHGRSSHRSHTHHSHDRKERYERSHHSSSRRGSPIRSHSRSSSPMGGGSKSDRGKYSSRGHTHSSSRDSGYERSREGESGSRHSKSEHTTPTSRVHTTTSPHTPVSGNLSQTGLVSPSVSTPHSSTPYTSLTSTTPNNSISISILSMPQSSCAQQIEQAMPGAQLKLPHTQQQQQQASNGIYVQDTGVGGVGGVAMGYVGVGGGGLSTPQTVTLAGVDSTGLHPLQKALLIQNQVQNYSVVEPNVAITPVAQAIPHHMTQQQSHPNSPVVQSPISIPQHGTGTPLVYGTQTAVQTAQPMTPVQQTVFALPGATPHGTFDPTLGVPGGFVTVNSPTLCTPMSSLGYQRTDSTQFPDLSKLETVDASHMNMELFNRGLAEPWNQYQNQIQQQIESCQLESLQRRTTETIFLSSKLARSRLRLETSQVSTLSRDNRLSGLKNIIEDISNR